MVPHSCASDHYELQMPTVDIHNRSFVVTQILMIIYTKGSSQPHLQMSSSLTQVPHFTRNEEKNLKL
jgi:hypothetical protein